MGHLALSQDHPLKGWDTSHCPKTLIFSVGTLHTVPRPSVRTPRTAQDLFVVVLGHFSLSQDLSFKCWDTSHCLKTLCPSVGTLHTVPRPSVTRHFTLSQDTRTVLRPYTQVLGHLALSQDHPLKRRDTSHCPKTLRPSVGTLHPVPRPSVGTPRTSLVLLLVFFSCSPTLGIGVDSVVFLCTSSTL